MANEDKLERSPFKLERELFELIWSLTEKQPWLKLRQSALISLIDECENDEQQRLVFELLEKFKYLDGEDYAAAISAISRFVVEDLKLQPEHSAIAAREVSQFSDSSQRVTYDLKAFGGLSSTWTTNRFVGGLKEIGDLEVDDVVLVDEFLGSGESMIASVNYVRNQAKANGRKIRIHCALVAAMEFGLERLSETADRVFAVHALRKGITDEYAPSIAATKIALMSELETGLNGKSGRGKLNKHRLGYKKSESLYTRHQGNTPNNVFPIFWWEKSLDGRDRDRLLECR